MKDQDAPGNETERRCENPVVSVVPIIGAKSNAENRDNDRECSETHLNNYARYFKAMTPYEFTNLLITGFTLAALIVTAVVYYCQLQEMQKSTEATTIAAKAAEKAAKIAEGQLDQMKSGSEQTDKIIAEANRISVSLQDSLKQSHAALDASIEASRTDQRAWVFVIGVEATRRDGKTLYTVNYTNSGKTPAIIKKQQTDSLVSTSYPLPETYAPRSKLTDSEMSKCIVGSGLPARMFLDIPDDARSKFLGDFKGTSYTYIDGLIEYEDIYGKTHRTRFCYFQRSIDPPDGLLIVAPNRNSID